MIDVEVAIYNQIIQKLTELTNIPGSDFPARFSHSSEYVRRPAFFPHISIEEIDNSTVTSTRSSGHPENHANLTFEINIYSNKTTGKKAECRQMARAIDEVMQSLNFTCVSLKPIPNVDDATIYRMVGRYTVTVDTTGRLYFRR